MGRVELPIPYYDTSNVLAYSLCDTKRVERALQSTGLKPAFSIANRTVIAISFDEYRKTTVGSYNEVGVAIPVMQGGTKAPFRGINELYSDIKNRELGFYVLSLPVTTELANAAGRELWGYPKFVTEISFHLGGGCFHSIPQHERSIHPQEPVQP